MTTTRAADWAKDGQGNATEVAAAASPRTTCLRVASQRGGFDIRTILPRVLIANVKSKAALETYIRGCPFGSDIRKNSRGN
ncbi:hypothetical protein, partial [Bradyrhizobium sp.]|uniref:hypothetical protein n=1 Tax=Bradyrhizobium sp. TaxID=376 RepID=UPI00261F8174